MTFSSSNREVVDIVKIVGKGYGEYWRCRKRYRVCKGSRGSKKSKTTALFYIYQIMRHPQANLLVIRKTYRTLADSCYTDLRWATMQLKVNHLFDFKASPLEIIYRPTGQKILFRGLDDPLKVTSISVDTGVLCWCWIEEAYEINKEEDFDMINESIRGQTPSDLWKQITLTFNPWNEKHWLKKRFYDNPSDDTLAITTNYMCNEYLDESDIRVFEDMKINNPTRYKVAGLGQWGIVDGVVFENWEEQAFDVEEIKQKYHCIFGLDFGLISIAPLYSNVYRKSCELTNVRCALLAC